MSGYIGPAPVPQATQTREAFTATSGQTTFNTGGYTAGFIDVYLNGVKLAAADYTATNGSDVVLAVGAAADDILETVAYSAFTVADQTFTGDIVMSDGLTVDNDGATVLTVDRATSDGTIIDVQKDGSSVGSIGSLFGDIYVGTGDTGLKFTDSSDVIVPLNTGTLAERDAAVSLGQSGTRFKDLYLSGGVYLGGTGAANKLDDYEEGTWTPAYDCATTSPTITYDSTERSASYIKIGKMVFIQGTIRTDAASGGSGGLLLAGLPFSSKSSGSERCGGFSVSGYQSGFGASHPTGGYINNGSTEFVIMGNSDTATATGLDASDLGSGANNNFMMFHGQYEID